MAVSLVSVLSPFITVDSLDMSICATFSGECLHVPLINIKATVTALMWISKHTFDKFKSLSG